MAKMPGYTQRIVSGLANDPPIIPRLLIFHVDAVNADSLFNWFNGPSNGIESHGFIPRSDTNDNEQYRDTEREADANFRANSWTVDGKRYGAISIETGGLGPGTWNPRQIHDIKATIKWAHDEHDIPYVVPDKYRGRGVGYHTLHPEWSNVSGKTCPGPDRIRQFRDIIVPWMESQRPLVIDVKAGDTWRSIADRHDTSLARLTAKNPPKAGTRIRVR
jgi:hypothetical protein